VVSHWIIELGELEATFKKSDVNKLKSFITSQLDVVRLPWARKISEFPRRTVFCASVNQADFLVDTTGNSRWWVLPCRRVEYRHTIDMQQLWAQAYQMYLQEPVWWLSREEDERLAGLNREFEASDEVEDLIGAGYPWDRYEEYYEVGDGDWVNATLILKACGVPNPTKIQVRRAGEVLRELTKREPKRMGKNRDRCYWVPRKREFYM
jgi:putative DNA primase/helicase